VASSSHLHPVLAARVWCRRVEPCGLVALHGRCELGSVAPGDQQGHCTCFESHVTDEHASTPAAVASLRGGTCRWISVTNYRRCWKFLEWPRSRLLLRSSQTGKTF